MDTKNVICRAGAGCGKTSTAIAGINLIRGKKPEFKGTSQQEAIWDSMMSKGATDIAIVAFNKPIAEELKSKVPSGVEASTFHSMCFAAVRDAFGRVKVDNFKVDNIIDDLLGVKLRKKNPILFHGTKKLVELAKATLWDHVEADLVTLQSLIDYYSIELNGNVSEAIELTPKIMERCKHDTKRIDFSDMVWFVHAHDLPIHQRDLLLVDEAQDLNRLQQEIALSAGSRLILIGDPNQSIYGFRGADCESIPRMFDILNDTDKGVNEFPLMQTFRCPQSHVELAKKIVPEFEAYDPTREGVISNQDSLGVPKNNSLVLCRTNAPLISEAFRLIKNGIKANIQGRDIGANIMNLIKKITDTSKFKTSEKDEITSLLQGLDYYADKERDRIFSARFFSGTKLVNLEDKVSCIQTLVDGADTIKEIEDKIKILFQDGSRDGVLLSSVHRAKGLESDDVFILEPQNIPHPMAKNDWEVQQEINCKYVALTRSRNSLTFVDKK